MATIKTLFFNGWIPSLKHQFTTEKYKDVLTHTSLSQHRLPINMRGVYGVQTFFKWILGRPDAIHAMFTTGSVGTYRIHEKNSCGSCQIQAHATSCKWQQKHCWWTGTSVGKALYSSGPGLLHHPPVQPDKSEAFFVKRLFDEIQKWRELRNYKAFCRGILISDGT